MQSLCNLWGGGRNDFSDDVIAAGGLPEGFGEAAVRYIVDHRPGVKNLRIAKEVTVIPVADFLKFAFFPIVAQQLLHFLGCEAEVFAVAIVQNGIGLQIVHAAKDALFRHTQNSGEETKGEMGIVLQAPGEEVPHEAHNFIVEIAAVSLLDGRVIFIDDDHCFLVMVLMQQQGKKL